MSPDEARFKQFRAAIVDEIYDHNEVGVKLASLDNYRRFRRDEWRNKVFNVGESALLMRLCGMALILRMSVAILFGV
jgi:hypothetical protein